MIHDTGASINNEPSRDTESEREPEPEPEPKPEAESHSITDADVVEALQKGIREAARDNDREELINEGEASLYYDSLTMSPLNAMSAVSFLSAFVLFISLFCVALSSVPFQCVCYPILLMYTADC